QDREKSVSAHATGAARHRTGRACGSDSFAHLASELGLPLRLLRRGPSLRRQHGLVRTGDADVENAVEQGPRRDLLRFRFLFAFQLNPFSQKTLTLFPIMFLR